ncbi:MAG: DotU family type IV/VI secretion system protein [Pseudomonadota bacterium]
MAIPVAHPPAAGNKAAAPSASLLDLMGDGFYALFILKHGSTTEDGAGFIAAMTQFLDEFVRGAAKMGAARVDIDAARYAFCAAIDEAVLHSNGNLQEQWERRPLQLVVFGDQLAGENFYLRLEELRAKGSLHLQALEVFHMCLLLGFHGRYIVGKHESIDHFTARLGDEIAHMKGRSGGFAPHAQRPDQFVNKLRNDVPLWVFCSLFALIGLLGYGALRATLHNHTQSALLAYNDVVKLAPRPAHLTITLP